MEEETQNEKKDEEKEQKQMENEKGTLKNFFVVLGILAVFIIGGIFFINSVNHFEYEGVKFNVVKEGDIFFYNIVYPMVSVTGKHVADYNVYLRNDPRKLKKIPFDGAVVLKNVLVLNSTGNFNCDGDGVIAIANFAQILETLKIKAIRDANATCDANARYTFINLQQGNTTSIVQTGPSCYEFNINNCEILKVTEKFLVEMFAKMKR